MASSLRASGSQSAFRGGSDGTSSPSTSRPSTSAVGCLAKALNWLGVGSAQPVVSNQLKAQDKEAAAQCLCAIQFLLQAPPSSQSLAAIKELSKKIYAYIKTNNFVNEITSILNRYNTYAANNSLQAVPVLDQSALAVVDSQINLDELIPTLASFAEIGGKELENIFRFGMANFIHSEPNQKNIVFDVRPGKESLPFDKPNVNKAFKRVLNNILLPNGLSINGDMPRGISFNPNVIPFSAKELILFSKISPKTFVVAFQLQFLSVFGLQQLPNKITDEDILSLKNNSSGDLRHEINVAQNMLNKAMYDLIEKYLST
jgi:hypothetical protein